jgi:hypothetical protein
LRGNLETCCAVKDTPSWVCSAATSDCPKFGIRHPKNCTIGDPRHADQCLFDFGRIDVYPAQKHQISSAVADVEIPFVIEIAEVSN